MNIKKKLKMRCKYNHYSRLMWELQEFFISIKGADFSGCFCKGGHPWVVHQHEGGSNVQSS